MKQETRSAWVIIKEFINSKEIGSIITRQEIINEVYTKCNVYIKRYDKTYNRAISQTTIDYYRNILTSRAEYLEKTQKDGIYKIKKYIQPKLSASDIRKLYDSLI